MLLYKQNRNLNIHLAGINMRANRKELIVQDGLKILVFDDTDVHRQSAFLCLDREHDLTVVKTYDEAQMALLPACDYARMEELFPGILEEKGLPRDFKYCTPEGEPDPSEEDRKLHIEARSESRERATKYPDFDVVLTDLLVPASRQAQGDKGRPLVGQEMPLGTTIALLAISAGVKNVAVVTDMNHHHHPASAAFDCMSKRIGDKIPGLRLLCTNHVGLQQIDEATGEFADTDFLGSAEGKEKHPYLNEGSWGPRKGILQGKDWKRVLDQLLGNESL